MTHGHEKSDPAIVATKPMNKAGQLAAEPAERRAGTEGNADQQSTRRAQDRESVSQALDRVRQAARQRRKEKFTALFHHLSLPILRTAFFALKREAAPGVDGLTWGSGANSRRRKASRVVLSRLQAWSTAFHTAGASRSWTPRRPSPNCRSRMRCINSIPAIVIAAVAKPLKPSIVGFLCSPPRWSCSIRLFKYFDDRSFVSAGSKPLAFSSRTAR